MADYSAVFKVLAWIGEQAEYAKHCEKKATIWIEQSQDKRVQAVEAASKRFQTFDIGQCDLQSGL
jgi:hypothetical protein